MGGGSQGTVTQGDRKQALNEVRQGAFDLASELGADLALQKKLTFGDVVNRAWVEIDGESLIKDYGISRSVLRRAVRKSSYARRLES